MSSIVSTSHELSKLQNTFCGQTTEYCALRVKNTPHLRLIQSLRTQRPCHTSSKAWCLSMAGASPFFNFYTFFTCLDYIAMTKIMRHTVSWICWVSPGHMATLRGWVHTQTSSAAQRRWFGMEPPCTAHSIGRDFEAPDNWGVFTVLMYSVGRADPGTCQL